MVLLRKILPCTYAWYVSYTGCYIQCGKRTWNGTFHHGGTYMFKPFDFTFRKVIPNGVRMPAYIVIVASLVTVVQFLMQAYLPSLSAALGVYIPLIVVNCIILGRAESYASKNPPVESIFDGMGMGLGFTMGLTIIGLIREILGAGTFFNIKIFGDWFTPITIFIMAPEPSSYLASSLQA